MKGQTVLELAVEVAECMGGEWTVRETENKRIANIVDNPDVASIHFYVDTGWHDAVQDHHRVIVSGRYPTQYSPENAPRITVAVQRGPAVIAREIERRFLPKYLLLHEQITERKRQADEVEAHRMAMVRQLAEAAGGIVDKSTARYFSDCDQVRLTGGPYGWYGWIEVRSDGTVVFDVGGFPFGLALQVAAVLRDWRESQDEAKANAMSEHHLRLVDEVGLSDEAAERATVRRFKQKEAGL